MTDDCGAMRNIAEDALFGIDRIGEVLKVAAVVAGFVALFLLIPDPKARDASLMDSESYSTVQFPFGSALSLRAALPTGSTQVDEPSFSVVDAPLPPARTLLTRHIHLRAKARRDAAAEQSAANVKVAKKQARRVGYRNPLVALEMAAHAIANDISRGLRRIFASR
ncbi:MAG: hypothetical protein N2444_09335 [Methylocystis sp.]|nr:hypothetical protein [Methylocystis sp.]